MWVAIGLWATGGVGCGDLDGGSSGVAVGGQAAQVDSQTYRAMCQARLAGGCALMNTGACDADVSECANDWSRSPLGPFVARWLGEAGMSRNGVARGGCEARGQVPTATGTTHAITMQEATLGVAALDELERIRLRDGAGVEVAASDDVWLQALRAAARDWAQVAAAIDEDPAGPVRSAAHWRAFEAGMLELSGGGEVRDASRWVPGEWGHVVSLGATSHVLQNLAPFAPVRERTTDDAVAPVTPITLDGTDGGGRVSWLEYWSSDVVWQRELAPPEPPSDAGGGGGGVCANRIMNYRNLASKLPGCENSAAIYTCYDNPAGKLYVEPATIQEAQPALVAPGEPAIFRMLVDLTAVTDAQVYVHPVCIVNLSDPDDQIWVHATTAPSSWRHRFHAFAEDASSGESYWDWLRDNKIGYLPERDFPNLARLRDRPPRQIPVLSEKSDFADLRDVAYLMVWLVTGGAPTPAGRSEAPWDIPWEGTFHLTSDPWGDRNDLKKNANVQVTMTPLDETAQPGRATR